MLSLMRIKLATNFSFNTKIKNFVKINKLMENIKTCSECKGKIDQEGKPLNEIVNNK